MEIWHGWFELLECTGIVVERWEALVVHVDEIRLVAVVVAAVVVMVVFVVVADAVVLVLMVVAAVVAVVVAAVVFPKAVVRIHLRHHRSMMHP